MRGYVEVTLEETGVVVVDRIYMAQLECIGRLL